MGDTRSLAASRSEHGKAHSLEAFSGLVGPLVPRLARVVLLEAGTGVDDEERGNASWMCAIEGKRHVATQRKPADDRASRADCIEQGLDIAYGCRLAVRSGILGIIGLAVTTHVPQHELVVFRQRRDLALPHR